MDFVEGTGLFFSRMDRRFGLRGAIQNTLRKPLPPYFNMGHYLGGIVLFLFGVQVITGVLLALYYSPSPETAYLSVQFINNQLPVGWLIREIHAWAADLLIIFLLLHLIRVYFMGAYKTPREFNWVVGVLLLQLFLIFAYTGYLLPWDQVRYWSLTFGIEKIRNLPIIGKSLIYLLQGGEEISGNTLTRFYVLHAIILPWVTTFAIWLHLGLVRRLGLADPFGDN
jgi:quinol-cytochrome oxidoreductase complex cytochrome b subunit